MNDIRRDMLIRKQQRHFSAHHMLIRTARLALDEAVASGGFTLFRYMTTMTFSALAIEALCNAIGQRLITGWKKNHERKSPNNKLRLLAEKLGIAYKEDDEPWKGAGELIKFRNDIAHAKPELIETEERITREEYERRERHMLERPSSELEKSITRERAEYALETAEAIKDLLCNKIPPELAMGLQVDGWSGRTSMLRD